MSSIPPDRLNEVIDAVLDRRAAGHQVSDESVIAKHPELMPALARRLRELRLIEDAVRHADAAPDATPLTATHLAGDGHATASSHRADAAPLPPDTFAGYEILRELSRGGQGVVYQSLQQSTKRKVAINVLLEGA